MLYAAAKVATCRITLRVNFNTEGETKMFFKKKSEINISDSINQAIESLRQALEIYLGYSIRFETATQINPDPVEYDAEGNSRSRTVNIHGRFHARLRSSSLSSWEFEARVWLTNRIVDWEFVKAHIGLREGEMGFYHTWLWADVFNNKDRRFPELRVYKDIPRKSDALLHCWIGHSFTDRRQVPFCGKPENCSCGGPDCGPNHNKGE